MQVTTITCYGGAGEIGGNKILLEDGDLRVFLDFGTAFNPHHAFFSDMLRPRATHGLLDLLVLGLLPPLEGLYREDLAPRGLWARLRSSPQYRDLRRRDGRPAVDAVLISHAHLDHNGDLAYLDTAIPVYSSRVSAFIARAMQLTGASGLERELTFVNPRVAARTGDLHTDPRAACRSRPHAFVDGALTRRARAFWQRAPSRSRTLEMADARKAGALRGLRVRAWPVDHSVPGAVGLAVETSAGWIGYTGDIRFHGKGGDRTRRFAQELAALRPAALICEGTHTRAAGRLTEAGIVENALPLVRQAAGQLAVADFGARNIERLLSFAEIAAQAGRSLVIQPKDLYLLHAIGLADPDAFPGPLALPNLLLFDNPKAVRRPWERALRLGWRRERTVRPLDVARRPGDYILAWSLYDLGGLLDLGDLHGGIYLYSNSRAYDEEQAADLQRLRNWVGYMDLALCGDPDDPDAVSLHTSGHASGPELVEFVHTVQPRVLIPVHTRQPEWWLEQLKGTGIEVQVPIKGVAVALS